MKNSQLAKAWDRIGTKKFPLLWAWRQEMAKTKPLSGLKIYHNIPLSIETVCKVEALTAAGALVVTSATNFLIPASHDEAKDLLESANMEFRAEKYAEPGEFDVYLDCCAELSHLPPPRLGAVELTRSGVLHYRERNPSYPVISVDDSRIKSLETFHGTGEGFVRAFRELTGRDPSTETFAIVGYGKVGQGVAHWLRATSANCIVYDTCSWARRLAKNRGFQAHFPIHDDVITKRSFEDATVVVTATGRPNILRETFPGAEEIFTGKIICNIGAENEIGHPIENAQVLAHGMAINFTLKEPTASRYLDPSFCAHSMGAELLKDRIFLNGLNALPHDVDDALLTRWLDIHNEPIDFIGGIEQRAFADVTANVS